jgi:hypothetical protein
MKRDNKRDCNELTIFSNKRLWLSLNCLSDYVVRKNVINMERKIEMDSRTKNFRECAKPKSDSLLIAVDYPKELE